jgi:hypothetical protein
MQACGVAQRLGIQHSHCAVDSGKVKLQLHCTDGSAGTLYEQLPVYHVELEVRQGDRMTFEGTRAKWNYSRFSSAAG